MLIDSQKNSAIYIINSTSAFLLMRGYLTRFCSFVYLNAFIHLCMCETVGLQVTERGTIPALTELLHIQLGRQIREQ